MGQLKPPTRFKRVQRWGHSWLLRQAERFIRKQSFLVCLLEALVNRGKVKTIKAKELQNAKQSTKKQGFGGAACR